MEITEMRQLANERILNTFLARLSQKIEEFEDRKGTFPISIKVVDDLPTVPERSKMEEDLLNMLAKQGWQIRKLRIDLQKPAIIEFNFELQI